MGSISNVLGAKPLNTTFRPNIKQSRVKKHSLENAVCYRKDIPAGTQFLPSPCDKYLLANDHVHGILTIELLMHDQNDNYM